MGRLCSPFEKYLRGLHARFADLREGKVATYIPELATADPEAFGICIVTVEGRVYEVGDTRRRFTIQSISKPLAYGLALDTWGLRKVSSLVGVEPSGEAFNSISLEPGSGRPLNPMINAGAIATSSMVAGQTLQEKTDNLCGMFERYVGRPVEIDDAVYRSESATGHRNRAIGYLLRNFEILKEDPHDTLELYFRQCAASIDCRDLAIIGATLAAGGSNPMTGARALAAEHVHRVLSVMMSSGMYDFAGNWACDVGLPAKSGVAGGILATLPGQFGVGVFSPRLDEKGNSVRGIQVCRSISRDWGLHCFNVPQAPQTAIRARYDAATVTSKRRQPASRRAWFEEHGDRIVIYDLQGNLSFSGAESVVQRLLADLVEGRSVIIDFKRVLGMDTGSSELFEQLGQLADPRVDCMKFCSLQHLPGMSLRLQAAFAAWEGPAVFPDRDLALEWCENRLELSVRGEITGTASRSLCDVDLLAGLSDQDLACVQAYLVSLRFRSGEFIVRQGDRAEEIYLLLDGEVSVTTPLAGGGQRRLATMQAGMAFGERALMGGGTRGADIRADTDVHCYSLSATAFEELGLQHLRIQNRLLRNLLLLSTDMLTRTTREIAALAG